MPANSDARDALTALRASAFKVNADWETAHEIAQQHEGEPVFDAIHALLHRIEGDHGNAAYWDRRAGTSFGGDGFENELTALEAMANRT